jgi:hypothetical protein
VEILLDSEKILEIDNNFTCKIPGILKNKRRNSFASYFDKNLTDLALQYCSKSKMNISFFYDKLFVHDKMRYLTAIGRFLANRGCYDFIEFSKNINNVNAKEKTEKNILKGLNLIIDGYDIANTDFSLKTTDTQIQDYLNCDQCYNTYIQKTLARNFTILIGLGQFSNDGELRNRYITLLAKLDKKEKKKKMPQTMKICGVVCRHQYIMY